MRKARVRDTKAVRTEASRIPKVGRHLAIREARHLAKATKAKEKAPLMAIATTAVSMGTEQLTALSRGRTGIWEWSHNSNSNSHSTNTASSRISIISRTQTNGVHLW